MNFISTRGIENKFVSAAYAIKTGIASDGGLYMPESIPQFSEGELENLSKLNYFERAAHVIGKFLTDYSYEELLEDAKNAYSPDKFGKNPAPTTSVCDGISMLELWHGPTCAFKDMALQIMPRLFVRALKKTDESRTALILVATSGDTGKAALEGYRDINGTKILVFYPTDGVSRVQKLQMQTQEGCNLSVLGIKGNFDDAQSGVKKIFGSEDMTKSLNDKGYFFSSANSINWGRLVPQIVYYVSSYLDMVNSGKISMGEKIDVCVPTGNFGNIFAGYIAKLMGLPIEKLICASNSNNVLTDFLSTGIYDKNRSFYQTMSPSMDILISSNLERLLYLTAGQVKTREYMQLLANEGKYRVDDEVFTKIKDNFIGYYADEAETQQTIKTVFEKENCLIDTHTSVAVCSAKKYMNAYGAERKILVVSTASPYKFAKDVYKSLAGSAKFTDDTEALDALSTLTGVECPTPLSSVLSKPILHAETIEREGMNNAVLDFINS